jgi:hypothetical protein
MQELSPRLKATNTLFAQQLYAHQVAGELGWMDLRYALISYASIHQLLSAITTGKPWPATGK